MLLLSWPLPWRPPLWLALGTCCRQTIVSVLIGAQKPVRHASSLTIEPHLGDFEGLEDTYLNNNNLVIPVSFYNWPLRAAVQVFTGIEPKPDNLGVLNDLSTGRLCQQRLQQAPLVEALGLKRPVH